MRPFFGEKSTKPIKYPWTWAEIERQWRAGKEEGQIVSHLPMLGPCVASGNATATGLDRE